MALYGIINNDNKLCAIEKRGYKLGELAHPDFHKYYIEISEELCESLTIGAAYDPSTGSWCNPPEPVPEPEEVSSAELRKRAYSSMRFKSIENDGDEPEPLIYYRDVIYTVDEALAQFALYRDEDALNTLVGTPTHYATELGALIPSAKDYIRKLYP